MDSELCNRYLQYWGSLEAGIWFPMLMVPQRTVCPFCQWSGRGRINFTNSGAMAFVQLPKFGPDNGIWSVSHFPKLFFWPQYTLPLYLLGIFTFLLKRITFLLPFGVSGLPTSILLHWRSQDPVTRTCVVREPGGQNMLWYTNRHPSHFSWVSLGPDSQVDRDSDT